MDATSPGSTRSTPRRRVTVRDIAAATGVHFTTVSLALRNSPLLNAHTRERLQAAAREMGYVPDPMLNALTVYRQASRTPRFQAVLAWIDNWPERGSLRANDTFNDYYEGACDRARQLGYLVEEIWLHEAGMNPEKLRRILKAQGVQGMLLAPQPVSNTDPGIDFREFSAVCFGYSMQPALLNVVTNHHYHSITLAYARLVELGYRRIGLCVDTDWDQKVDNSWMAGWMISTAKYAEKIASVPPFCLRIEDAPRLKDWLGEHRPDAVIAVARSKEVFEQIGYAIPEDLGFCCLDQGGRDDPRSGTHQNNALIGHKAVDVLIGMIHRDERGVPETPIRTLVESVWMPGTTLRRVTPKD